MWVARRSCAADDGPGLAHGLPQLVHVALAFQKQGAAQVATRECVWLVDLMALRGGPGLSQLLPQLLRAPSVLKLGCSLSSDLTALVRTRAAATSAQYSAGQMHSSCCDGSISC